MLNYDIFTDSNGHKYLIEYQYKYDREYSCPCRINVSWEKENNKEVTEYVHILQCELKYRPVRPLEIGIQFIDDWTMFNYDKETMHDLMYPYFTTKIGHFMRKAGAYKEFLSVLNKRHYDFYRSDEIAELPEDCKHLFPVYDLMKEHDMDIFIVFNDNESDDKNEPLEILDISYSGQIKNTDVFIDVDMDIKIGNITFVEVQKGIGNKYDILFMKENPSMQEIESLILKYRKI